MSAEIRFADLAIDGPTHSVADRWRQVAGLFADRPAIVSADSLWSYGRADLGSEAIASHLAAVPGTAAVAVLGRHSAEVAVAVLGVFKSGRPVVVLDTHQPISRLREIAELAGAGVCLVDRHTTDMARDILPAGCVVVELSTLLPPLDELVMPGLPGALRPRPAGGRDAAAIVYTSGSTGRPKGVIQTHDQMLNESADKGRRFRFTVEDRAAMVLPFGFAAGLSHMVTCLLNGVGLWCLDPRDSGTRALIGWIVDHRLTDLHCTPHLLRSLVGHLAPDQVLSTLRVVSTVGEAVYGNDVAAVRPHLPATASFFNETGSSESGTLALHEIPASAPLPPSIVPAGRLIVNKDVLLLGPDEQPAPPGEAGQIVVISDFLSGGYRDPTHAAVGKFGVAADGRPCYRMGDLGRFDGDGNLILVGRTDAAVKVRGYLVEPGDVEAAFLASGSASEVIVIPETDSSDNVRLTAYFVPKPAGRADSVAVIRRRLRELLPEYMVPTSIMQLTQLPRNERGKVDRTALPPVPAPVRMSPPESRQDVVMADAWQQVLGLDYIDLDDEFTVMGGDSLSVEELLAIVEQRYGVRLVSSDLVESPTLREFSRRVSMESVALPRHPDVVRLQVGDGGDPIFCFAGSGALALSFGPLSRHMVRHPVFAFQAHGLEGRGIPDWSVQASARRFLQTIRLLQPQGPYVLLGHSFGGLVALEIAQMLHAAEETVDLVGVLDTYLPENAGALPPSVGAPAAVSRRGRTVLRRVGGAFAKQLRRALPEVITGRAYRHLLAKLTALFVGVVVFDGQRQFDSFFEQGVLISHRYRPRPYAGRVVVVQTDDNPAEARSWDRILTGQTRHVRIKSEHSAMLREPHAAEIAAILADEYPKLR